MPHEGRPAPAPGGDRARPEGRVGKQIGHVSHVGLDGTGGAWLEVATDWGLLDWLTGMGAGHTRLTFHSDDMEPRGGDLVLKQSIFDQSGPGETAKTEAA